MLISMRGSSSGSSERSHDRNALCDHVGQSRVMSARTRAGVALAGQPVGRLPRRVAGEHVDLEVLVGRHPLEQCGLERVAERADGIGEDVVQHRTATLGLGYERGRGEAFEAGGGLLPLDHQRSPPGPWRRRTAG